MALASVAEARFQPFDYARWYQDKYHQYHKVKQDNSRRPFRKYPCWNFHKFLLKFPAKVSIKLRVDGDRLRQYLKHGVFE